MLTKYVSLSDYLAAKCVNAKTAYMSEGITSFGIMIE